MAFPEKTTVDTDFTALADLLTPGTYTPSELKSVFHNNWNNILVYLNDIKAVLESTTADSGAHNTGSQAISGVAGANVHAQLTAIKALIDALPLDNTISTTKLVDLAVTTAKLADLAITTGKLANDSVTTAKILDLNVATSKLANLAVTTAKIADLNVTNAKIAEGTITENKIVAGTLDNRYYTETETDAKLDAVVLGQIPDGSLTNIKLATDIKVGSLASLTTTDKTNVVASINEVDAEVAAHKAENVTEFQLTRIRSYMEV